MSKLIHKIAIITLFFSASVFGVHVKSLYQAEVPVASQTPEARSAAMRQGLIQVLTKLTGNPEVETNGVIKPTLEKPEFYVQEYTYLPAAQDSTTYLMQIKYEQNVVNRLLRRAGMGYWGGNRPLILVWVAYTDADHTTEVIGNENQGALFNAIHFQGKRYGIPLIFPVMDVSEVDQITPLDVVQMTLPKLNEAAKRYSPDGLLIGRVEVAGKASYDSEWKLVIGKKEWSWKLTDATLETLFSNITYQISQTLAKQYASKILNAPKLWVTIQVTHVLSREDLINLMEFLRHVGSVQQIHLAQVKGDNVELSVLISGSVQAFQQNTSIGQRLILRDADLENSKLVYEWVPEDEING